MGINLDQAHIEPDKIVLLLPSGTNITVGSSTMTAILTSLILSAIEFRRAGSGCDKPFERIWDLGIRPGRAGIDAWVSATAAIRAATEPQRAGLSARLVEDDDLWPRNPSHRTQGQQHEGLTYCPLERAGAGLAAQAEAEKPAEKPKAQGQASGACPCSGWRCRQWWSSGDG